MNKTGKLAIVLVLAAAVGAVWIVKHLQPPATDGSMDAGEPVMAAVPASDAAPVSAGPPRLLDLGADKCIPCKMMFPVLEALETEYAGRLQVDFIDVWKNPDEAPKYNVTTIPTQIFFDPDGRELYRHVGFFAKEDILAQWQRLGYDLNGPQANQTQPEAAQKAAEP